MEFNAKEVKDQVVRWIRDWFEVNGKGCNAVLGISGGKDGISSALTLGTARKTEPKSSMHRIRLTIVLMLLV
jgi:NH3-dependent NAD+ synthetase